MVSMAFILLTYREWRHRGVKPLGSGALVSKDALHPA